MVMASPIIGSPSFGTSASGAVNADSGNTYGPTLYVNSNNAGSGNGRSPKNAFVTMAEAFSALFSLIIVMTNGGPGYGSTTLEFFISEQAFTENNFGVGATAGVVLFLLVFVVSMVQMRVLRSDD